MLKTAFDLPAGKRLRSDMDDEMLVDQTIIDLDEQNHSESQNYAESQVNQGKETLEELFTRMLEPLKLEMGHFRAEVGNIYEKIETIQKPSKSVRIDEREFPALGQNSRGRTARSTTRETSNRENSNNRENINNNSARFMGQAQSSSKNRGNEKNRNSHQIVTVRPSSKIKHSRKWCLARKQRLTSSEILK